VGVGQLTELSSKGDLRSVVQLLISEEDHLPSLLRSFDQGSLIIGEWLGDVDAFDQGSGVAREGKYPCAGKLLIND
jgi:hypothetical protein